MASPLGPNEFSVLNMTLGEVETAMGVPDLGALGSMNVVSVAVPPPPLPFFCCVVQGRRCVASAHPTPLLLPHCCRRRTF